MIMRRLAENLREQNWTAIFIEFVLLVLGVFLGIQVANWNEARLDRQREAEFIARMQRDFDRIDARLNESLAKWQMNLTSANQLLSDVAIRKEQGEWPRDKAAMLIDLNNITSTRSPAPRAATYVEMQSSAQLGILSDASLRDALREYDSRTLLATGLYGTLVARTDAYRSNFLVHLRFDTGLNLDALIEQRKRDIANGTPLRADYFNDVDLDALAGDPVIPVALTVHASTFLDQMGVIRIQQDDARAVLAHWKDRAGSSEGNAP